MAIERHRRADWMQRKWDDPMEILKRAEKQAAESPSGAWHHRLTESQEQAIGRLLRQRDIVPPHDPRSLSRIEAARWLTWLQTQGRLPPESPRP